MSFDYKKEKPFVYVIVCADLSFRHRVVQSCHAALESGLKLDHCKDFPSGMVVLQVKDEKELIGAEDHLHRMGIKCHMFYENPMNRYTALATEVIPKDKRRYLRQYKLLSMHRSNILDKIKRLFK